MKRQAIDWREYYQIIYQILDLYPEYIQKNQNSVRNQPNEINEENFWTESSPKKIYKSQLHENMFNTLINMRNYNLHQLKRLKWKSLTILSVDEDAEQLEL